MQDKQNPNKKIQIRLKLKNLKRYKKKISLKSNKMAPKNKEAYLILFVKNS